MRTGMWSSIRTRKAQMDPEGLVLIGSTLYCEEPDGWLTQIYYWDETREIWRF